MNFKEKLRAYRKQSGLSQEKLAETLNVSRQAITKWESGNGMPDILNLTAISKLFRVSVDDLLRDDDSERIQPRHRHESMIEYDVDKKKHFDINLAAVNYVVLRAVQGEKIKIQLSSDGIEHLQESVKVKIDDIGNRVDVDLKKAESLHEEDLMKDLTVRIYLPEKYAGSAELSAQCEKLELFDMGGENFELDGEASEIHISGGDSHIELNSNSFMAVYVSDYTGRIDMNQISATSRIYVPYDYIFEAVKKGLRTKLFFEEDGRATEPFSVSESENRIEINGINSALTIVRR